MRGTMQLRGVWLVSVCAVVPACGTSDWQPSDPNTAQGSGPNGANTPVYAGVDDSAHRPVPISGGTLTVLQDGHTAVASDPDRDRVWIVDLPTRALTHTVLLQPGDEPGRVVAGANGRVHVMLRRGGAVAVIDTNTGTVTDRRAVCAAPRGAAFDPTVGVLYVACSEGTLVSVTEATGAVVRVLNVQPDLRDVVMDNGVLRVSTFRSAQLITVNADGSFAASLPAQGTDLSGSGVTDTVAWRTIASRSGVWMTHQTAQLGIVAVPDPHSGTTATTPTPSTASSPYGGSACVPGIVGSVVTQYASGTMNQTFSIPAAVLPVDVATTSDGSRVALVAAGNAGIHAMPQLSVFNADGSGQDQGCGGVQLGISPPAMGGVTTVGGPTVSGSSVTEQPNGQVIAAAFDGGDHLVAQTRQPAAIYLVDEHAVVHLPGIDLNDIGHEMFQSNTGGNIACASCHPEGSDDGHVWNFSDFGLRRTQNLRGGIGTGPYHWGGEIPDFDGIMSTVFRQRMAGPPLESGQTQGIMDWVQSMPIASAANHAAMNDSAARGQALFNDPTVACSTCHNGPTLTNHAFVNVGTSPATTPMKVPPLVRIAQRPPYMHTGCAPTLRARFTDASCGGGDYHGHTSQLSSSQIDDLVAYLQTL